MTDFQDLQVGDYVVRRKRKRHTNRSFCCCREPDGDFLKDVSGLISGGSKGSLISQKSSPLSGYSGGLFDFSPGSAANMNVDGGPSVNERELQVISVFNSSETLIPPSKPNISPEPDSLDTDAETIITVDSFLRSRHSTKARIHKTYKAKYRVLSDSDDKPIDRAEILQLRSRRIVRTPPDCVSAPTSTYPDNNTSTSLLSCKIKRRLTRNPGKYKRKRLAERLIDTVVKTSGQPNDELLQARCKGGDLRVPITMETVPRSLIPDKPRKWSLVDPRKVIIPFQVSTFRAKREGQIMTEQTPTSYEDTVLHRYATVVTREAVEIDIQGQDSSSPCQKKVRRSSASLTKKSKVRFCEPLELDVVSINAVNKRKCTGKSRKMAATSKSESRRSKARSPPECETVEGQNFHIGQKSLNMAVNDSLDVTANKLDGVAACFSNRSQTDHDFLLSPSSVSSIPSSPVSELSSSPTLLSPVDGSHMIIKSPTLEFEQSQR